MTIRVTAKDIAAGDKALDACPVTLALRRYFGDNVSVSRDFIRILNTKMVTKKRWLFVPLPKAAQNFLLNYNAYQSVKSFSFEIPPESLKILKENT